MVSLAPARLLCVLVLTAWAVTACGAQEASDSTSQPMPDGDGAASVMSEQPSAQPSTTQPPPPDATTAEPTTAEPSPTQPAADDPAAMDQLAGVLSREVAQRGQGTLQMVPGSQAALGEGPVRTVSVEVEEGLAVDLARFAEFVMTTLNDPRGWTQGQEMSFARTDGPADVQVVLASPDTSAELCRPLVTRGTLSCRVGPRAIITHFRWVNGVEDYAGDYTRYRQYVVNHEVGHVLGHGHVPCPGEGEPAPLMMQQTLGLQGCLPNAWPQP